MKNPNVNKSEMVLGGDVDPLLELLSRPNDADVKFASHLDGDVIVLGAAGKMGPTLVRRLMRALKQAGRTNRVWAVSRFSDERARKEVEQSGAVTIVADLLNETQLANLPNAANVIYLVGMKFGSTGQEPLTWAMNTYLPGRVAERFASSRIVALSTGNVYGDVDVDSAGSAETDPLSPVGEYAQSAVGRERIFQHFSIQNGTPICLIRLNYAVEVRYGVLLDIAQKVLAREPVSLAMGYVNVIWQGDANSMCIRALDHCGSPGQVLNVTGAERLSVRDIAIGFGQRFGVDPVFQGHERSQALLSDSKKSHQLLGAPATKVDQVMEWVAAWISAGGPTLGKPTKFEKHDGRF